MVKEGRKRIGVVLGVACAVFLALMAASWSNTSRTPPEVVQSRSILSHIPSEQYTARWVDDRPFAGERSLVVSVVGIDRAGLSLQWSRHSPPGVDGCSVSTLDVDGGVEIAIWCGGFVATGSDAET